MMPGHGPRPVRALRAFMLCAERLDPADPQFLRVVALNGVLLLLGGSGLAFALFNAIAIGTAHAAALIAFDLGAFLTALAIGLYLWRTHDARRSAAAASGACFVAFLLLVTFRSGAEYFVLWAMLYPALAFMLHGMRAGALLAAAFLAVLYLAAASGLGEWNHGELNAIALSNLVGASLALTGIVAVYEGARRHAQGQLAGIRKALEEMSIRDGLTGICNRRCFNEALPRELARSSREHRQLALILLDVDHFKAYNDSFGHPSGDAVLRSIADALADRFRRSEDMVFRVGGEEFAILCHVRGGDEAAERAETVRATVEQLGIAAAAGNGALVTVSVGFAVLAGDGVTAAQAYSRADEALYRAKRGGRNRTARAGEARRPAETPES